MLWVFVTRSIHISVSMSTKSILISGKNNRYNMKKVLVDVERTPVERKAELEKQFYTHRIQLDLIKSTCSTEGALPLQYVDAVPIFMSHIDKKLYGYLFQDKTKNRVGSGAHITRSETIQKIVECGQVCYYCTENVFLLYTAVREASQWTLDRIDNAVRHSADNVVVACLACNLEKGTRGKTAFRLTKQMVIQKTDGRDECTEESDDDVYDEHESDDPFSQASSNIEYSQDT